MSWQNELSLMLRYIIDDLDIGVTPTYDDARLEQTLLIAAQLVTFEIDFDQDYTIDADACLLTPDPTAGTKDDGFINLVVMKAACMITASEFKTQSSVGIRVKDGPSDIDLRETIKGFQERNKRMCDDYEQLKIQYQSGNSRAGQAVTTPIVFEGIRASFGNL